MKDSKILLGIIAVALVVIVGGIFLLSKTNQPQVLSEALGIEATPTDKTIRLKKIATSCMCTTASFDMDGKTTKFFGMEGHGDANPPVNIEIGAGQEGKAIVKFDPAAHGPQGVGPFDRV